MRCKRGVPPRTVLNKQNLIYRGVPSSYVRYTIDDYKASSDKKNLYGAYLENLHQMIEDRVCLFNYGANGTGKTMLSSLVVKEGYRLRYDSFLITLASYMSLLFGDKNDDAIRTLKYMDRCDILVIDEVGKENFTQSKSNISVLENLLRQAVQRGQVVIINTNLNLEDFKEQYGASIASLINGDFTKIQFDERDFRPKVKGCKGRELLAEALKL